MEKRLFKEIYPVYESVLEKGACRFDTVDGIVAYLKERIDTHPVATYIAVFDHYAHTSALAEGEIAEGIEGAKNIIFCFGKELGTPEVLAVRPRSIGICDLGDRFAISFMEAPNPQANEAMRSWVESLAKG
ncbi:DUF6858 family protein [Hydrogenimonas sp.]